MENLEIENIQKEELKDFKKAIESSENLSNLLSETEMDKLFIKHVRTYNDACSVLHRQPCDPKRMRKLGFGDREIALHKLSEIITALNGGKCIKVLNKDCQNWYPKFRFAKNGSLLIFSHSECDTGEITLGNGTSFTLKSKELSDYCGNHFIKLWREAIL